MSRAQRLTFLAIAAAIAIVAVILLTASGGDEEPTTTSATTTPTPTATPEPGETPAEETPTPTPTPTAEPQPPLVTQGKVTKLRFEQGETVRFRVRANVADEVHVHGYDLKKDIEPGRTISFSFKADIPGIFEIELENAAEEIAQLRVDP